MGYTSQQSNVLYAGKRILVLCYSDTWLQTAESTLREMGCNCVVKGDTPLTDLDTLVKDVWDLIIMTSVGAFSGQKKPLESLLEWKNRGGQQPIAVVSPLPSPVETRDAIYHAGAVYYAKMPQDIHEFIRFLNESFSQVSKRSQAE